MENKGPGQTAQMHYPHMQIHSFRYVCVEVLRPTQPTEVMSSVISLPNHTFTGQT